MKKISSFDEIFFMLYSVWFERTARQFQLAQVVRSGANESRAEVYFEHDECTLPKGNHRAGN